MPNGSMARKVNIQRQNAISTGDMEKATTLTRGNTVLHKTVAESASR